MTVVQLRDHAKQYADIKGVSGMKKEELISILVEKHGIEVPKKKVKAARPQDRQSLKQKIIELKELRNAARTKNDRKTVDILRKQIHRTKRRLKKSA
jgi:hypothetical protein